MNWRTGKKREKVRNETNTILEKRQIEMGLNQKYEGEEGTIDGNYRVVRECELAELEKDIN